VNYYVCVKAGHVLVRPCEHILIIGEESEHFLSLMLFIASFRSQRGSGLEFHVADRKTGSAIRVASIKSFSPLV